MPRLPAAYTDGDLFSMLLHLSPRSERSLRQQADDHSSSNQWWILHAFFLSALVTAMVTCLGIFEYVRFSTFILEEKCFVQGHEIVELGACSACQGQKCTLYPKAMARVMVTFRPLHWDHNVSGIVSYCKKPGINSCLHNNKGPQNIPASLTFSSFRWQNWLHPSGLMPWQLQADDDERDCDLGKVYTYAQSIIAQPDRKCYYNSREPGGGQVWFSEQDPVHHGTLEVLNRQGVPLLCVFCAAALFLATLLGCLSLVD